MRSALLLFVIVAAGLGSRRFPALLPGFVARYAGDTLWAAMVYWGLALCVPRARAATLAGAAAAVSLGVEVSQRYHVRWLDAVRATRLGRLALGEGFLWSDLACYAVGVGLALLLDVALRRSKPPGAAPRPGGVPKP